MTARGRDLSCPADPLCDRPLTIWDGTDYKHDPGGVMSPVTWLGCPVHGGIRTVEPLQLKRQRPPQKGVA